MKFGLLLIDMLQRDGVMDGLGRKGERERERLEKETNGRLWPYGKIANLDSDGFLLD